MQIMQVLVAGAGGFIGGHLTAALVQDGHDVRAADIKPVGDWYQVHPAVENVSADVSLLDVCKGVTKDVDRVYNLACDMGGMGFIESNRSLCMLSVLVNTHLLVAGRENGVNRHFYSSSACVYNGAKQTDPGVTALKESDAYPAAPEDGYGWEKLFSERMCRHFEEDFGLAVRVARYHNVYGPYGTWDGGREKVPAAICRKVIKAKLGGSNEIEVWGDGNQTRSFMYIDDCVKGTNLIAESDVDEPLNLGTSELVSINDLVDIVSDIAGVQLKRIHNLQAPQGVRGRNSDNALILNRLGWEPSIPLRRGLEITYAWIHDEILAGHPGD